LGIGVCKNICKVSCGKRLYLTPLGSGLYIGTKIRLVNHFIKEFKRIKPFSNIQIIEKCNELNMEKFEGVFSSVTICKR